MSPAAATSAVAPDLVEPVLGWRCWGAVGDAGGRVALRSPVYATSWPMRAALAAQCGACRLHLRPPWIRTREHPAPAADCRCGVYAAARVETALLYLDSDISAVGVIGLVRLWGRVLECERGWRGERAYPLRLYAIVSPRRRDAERDRRVVAELDGYGVTVETLERGDLADRLARRGEPLELPRIPGLPKRRHG